MKYPTSYRTTQVEGLSIFYREALLVIWGKYDLSFDPGEPERYRKDVPKAEVHFLEAGHFALDTAADQVAALVQGFVR